MSRQILLDKIPQAKILESITQKEINENVER